jgi:hypothetical protein
MSLKVARGAKRVYIVFAMPKVWRGDLIGDLGNLEKLSFGVRATPHRDDGDDFSD